MPVEEAEEPEGTPTITQAAEMVEKAAEEKEESTSILTHPLMKELMAQPIPEAVEADVRAVENTITAAQVDPASYWSGGAINTNQCGSHYRDK